MKLSSYRLLLAAGLLWQARLMGWAQAPLGAVRVVDAQSGQPVPYASVGVSGRPLGTVANAEGAFPLSQVGAAVTDTVVVSCVGYTPHRLVASTLAPGAVVRLTPQVAQLAEVVVRSRPPKRVVLGHKAVSAFTSLNFYTQADTTAHARLGREIGVLLNVKQATELERFHLMTFGRDFRTVTFRLNLYTVRQGVPGESLLRQDVIFTVNGQQRGWTTVDLRPYAITLAGPQQVVASIQWLSSEAGRPDSRYLNVPAHLSASHTTYLRDKSAQAWRKYGANPNMYFEGLRSSQ